MIMQILGLLDMFIAGNLVARSIGFIYQPFILLSSGYLILKGVLFLRDPISIIELFIGVIFLTSLFVTWPKAVLLVSALIIFQKGFFSFLSR